MARKEFNVFSISFLDLLSGALAAMIIMFIIIPKMSQAEMEQSEEMQQIRERMRELDVTMEDLQRIQAVRESEQAMEAVRQLQETIAALQEEQQRMQQRMQEFERENRELQQQAEASASSGQISMDGVNFGVNAELAVTSKWAENLDVDLYLKDKRSKLWCYYEAKNTRFAKYLSDIQSRDNLNADSYEVIYQEKLIPGEYEVYLHLYSPSGTANVSSQVVVNPGTRRERKIDLGGRRLIHTVNPPSGGGLYLATINVTSQDVRVIR